MGFLGSAQAAILRGLAQAMQPPPPPDITRWCEENIEFDERSAFPGKFNIARFPFLKRIHEVLSPEHPCREVTVRGSAQFGKTVSILNATVAAWHAYGPLDSLVVHPTTNSATDWVRTKWMPMRRQAPGLRAIFGDGRGDQTDTLHNQETIRRDGTLKVTSAGSPDDLAGTTRRLVLMDDVSKFEMTTKGDPEELASSRAASFEDAKIVRLSTPQIVGTCRVSRAYARSTQELYHVPCPHCGNMAPLTWENFLKNLQPERLQAACFSCDSCGCVINHSHKFAMVAAGQWVAQNPRGDHPGFHLWRAYVPQRDWASIAVEYARVRGWNIVPVSNQTAQAVSEPVEAQTEQTFWNDVLGLPYAQASKGPDWTALRDRVENAAPEDQIPRGVIPARGLILAAGVDFQDDRIEVHVVGFGQGFRRHAIDYIVIPHHISTEEGRAALDAILKTTWRTQLGRRFALDVMAVDGGTYTDDVWSWAKRHPWSRVIIVKGSGSQTGPTMQPMKFERRADGVAKRAQKRAFLLNVSQMKAEFYAWLAKDDPLERGHCGFGVGLGDEYYRMVVSEVRTLKRQKSGTMTSQWDLVEPTRRNEGLDTMIYAEAAARRKGWASMTDEQWVQLTADRATPPEDAQPDLFDATATAVVEEAPAPAPAPAAKTASAPARDGSHWGTPKRDHWG